jgi:hypothetical protein
LSVLDDLRSMQERIAARYKELQPLVDEYHELARVAKRLGFDLTAAPPAPKRAATPKRRARSAAKRKPAAAKTKPAAKAKTAAPATPAPAAKAKTAAPATPAPAAKPAANAKAAAPAKPAPAAKPAAKAKPSGAAVRRQPGGTRAAGERRREQVLTLIRERPGITVPDMSKEMGVDAPPLYRVVRKLVSDKVVKKDGKGLTLV